MPRFEVLEEDEIDLIVSAAKEVLREVGVKVYNDEALKVYSEGGAEVDFDKKLVKLGEDQIKEALKRAPSSFNLYSRDGKNRYTVGEGNTYFIPGSAAIRVIDRETGKARSPLARDYVELVRLVNYLDNLKFQSTALIPSDVPKEISDRYRLYIALCNTNKPIYTGTFTIDGAIDMKDMLVAVAGSEEELAKKPRAAFTCCPSPPLKWSDITSQNVIDLAKYGIPVSILPMPLVGLASPATIAGSLVQHVAEFFSGLVLAEFVRPGTPVLFGGSPAPVDQRTATTLMGAVETVMMTSALSQIAKTLNVPTDMYVGLSNSNILDEQASAETMLGMALGALAGINMIEGAGMIEFESCQCFEKLVVDNEIAGIVYRLLKGIEVSEDLLALDILKEVGAGGSFTSSMKAMKLVMERFKEEIHLLGPLFNTLDRKAWEVKVGKDVRTKARELVKELLSKAEPDLPPEEVIQDLNRIMDSSARKYGTKLENLPWKCGKG
ncbi:MAG: hypothetical protein DRO05_08825 [Thermoproteota archaeon]|nr:MAG: hypothetical protein DRO05_08825 [Candidatus Korarchaeota archaeon]